MDYASTPSRKNLLAVEADEDVLRQELDEKDRSEDGRYVDSEEHQSDAGNPLEGRYQGPDHDWENHSPNLILSAMAELTTFVVRLDLAHGVPSPFVLAKGGTPAYPLLVQVANAAPSCYKGSLTSHSDGEPN